MMSRAFNLVSWQSQKDLFFCYQPLQKKSAIYHPDSETKAVVLLLLNIRKFELYLNMFSTNEADFSM
jgi:hypothetical protein